MENRVYIPNDFVQLADFYSKGISSKVQISGTAKTYSVNLQTNQITIPAIDVETVDETMLIFGVRHECEHLRHSTGFKTFMSNGSTTDIHRDILNCLDDPRIDLFANAEYENGKFFSDHAYNKYAPEPVTQPTVSQWIYALKYRAYFGETFDTGFTFGARVEAVLDEIHNADMKVLTIKRMLEHVETVYSAIKGLIDDAQKAEEYCECCGKSKHDHTEMSWICSDCEGKGTEKGEGEGTEESEGTGTEKGEESGTEESEDTEGTGSEESEDSDSEGTDSEGTDSEEGEESGGTGKGEDSDSEEGEESDSKGTGKGEGTEEGEESDSKGTEESGKSGTGAGDSDSTTEDDPTQKKSETLPKLGEGTSTWEELYKASEDIRKRLEESNGLNADNVSPSSTGELIKTDAKEQLINLITRLDCVDTEGEHNLNSDMVGLYQGIQDSDIDLVFSESFTPDYEHPESTIVLLLDVSSSMHGYWSEHPYTGEYMSKQIMLMHLVSEINAIVQTQTSVRLDCFIFGRYAAKWELPLEPSVQNLRAFVRESRVRTGSTYFTGIPTLIERQEYDPKHTLFLLVTDGAFSGYADNERLNELGERYAVTGLFLGLDYSNPAQQEAYLRQLNPLAREHLITNTNVAQASEIFVAALEHAEVKLNELS